MPRPVRSVQISPGLAALATPADPTVPAEAGRTDLSDLLPAPVPEPVTVPVTVPVTAEDFYAPAAEAAAPPPPAPGGAEEPDELAELIRLCAVDGILYSHTFFPNTFRQGSPHMHREVWAALDDTSSRFVGLEMFRGSAKTSLLRTFTSKRIAYGISHLILFVSNSETRAVESLDWLKRAILYNRLWADTFRLRQGGRWSQEEIEIIHGVEEYPIIVQAVGITGQVRGINVADYRPDLIVADDLDKEETAATPEQRKKTAGLFFGALVQSLVPASESAHAKAVLLQTPLARDDLVETCRRDPTWNVQVYGCFDSHGASRWEERFPTRTLLEEKTAYASRNQLSIWMREKECRIVSEETSSFRLAWLKKWTILPQGMWTVISIDPASSDSKKADFFAMVVLGFHAGKMYIIDYFLERGVMPDKAATELFSFIRTYRPRNVVVETVAYQKILSWYLKKEMDAQRVYVHVKEIKDKQEKGDRIL